MLPSEYNIRSNRFLPKREILIVHHAVLLSIQETVVARHMPWETKTLLYLGQVLYIVQDQRMPSEILPLVAMKHETVLTTWHLRAVDCIKDDAHFAMVNCVLKSDKLR